MNNLLYIYIFEFFVWGVVILAKSKKYCTTRNDKILLTINFKNKKWEIVLHECGNEIDDFIWLTGFLAITSNQMKYKI